MSSFLPAVLRGGVDVVQLREKVRPATEQLATARLMRSICHEFNVPFLVNDSPQLALEANADGVHVGQEDTTVTHCRELLGSEALVGLSTHSDVEFDAALGQDATYLSAGPIVETPTKLGRPGTGVEYARRSQGKTPKAVFVTGGVNASNVGDLVSAGLRHFVVVRALTDTDDPHAAATTLSRALHEALSSMTIEPT
jgi:thiamine-phosphate pyrophosphorylase